MWQMWLRRKRDAPSEGEIAERKILAATMKQRIADVAAKDARERLERIAEEYAASHPSQFEMPVEHSMAERAMRLSAGKFGAGATADSSGAPSSAGFAPSGWRKGSTEKPT